jgi:hypothetical protein
LFTIILVTLAPLVKAQKNDEWGVLPIADTYTDSSSNTPHGSESTLEIKNFTNILDQRRIELVWLKFSLGFLPSLPKDSVITGATIQLYCLDAIHPGYTISAHSSQNNSWEESSLIYSNMPHYNATPLDTVSLENKAKWYYWNVLDAVLQSVNNGSNVFTVVLQGDTVLEDIVPIEFISRENTIFIWAKPLLTIYHTIPKDTTPPTISIVSPENKTYTINYVALTFTVSESTSWMGYSLDAQANVTITGNITLIGLSEGSHSLRVYAKDAEGNTGTSETIYLSVKTQQSEPQRPEPQQSEPFQTIWIVAIVIIGIGVAITLGVVLYERKK